MVFNYFWLWEMLPLFSTIPESRITYIYKSLEYGDVTAIFNFDLLSLLLLFLNSCKLSLRVRQARSEPRGEI